MSKAVLFPILAPILYALGNVLMEYKFSKFNNLTIMILYGSVIVVLAIIVRWFTKTEDPSFNFPTGLDFWLLAAMGLIFFFADYFFIGSYTNGVDLMTVTILTVLFPVFASIFKFLGSLVISGMVYTLPNSMQISGYVLGVVAVILVMKGNAS